MKRILVIFFLLFCFLFPLDASSGGNPVEVAVNIAKTGIKVESDAGMIIGGKLASEYVNRNGGVLGRPLKMLYIDNRSTPLGARQAAEKAIQTDSVAVIGAGRSSFSIAMAPVLQKARMPMITHFSTLPAITRGRDYIFRVCYTDDFQGGILGHYAARELKAKTAVILEIINEEYSTTLAEFFIDAFMEYGGEVLWRGHYKTDWMDYEKILFEVKRQEPDIVFLPGYSKDSAWIIRQARNMGIETLFLGGDGWGLSMYDFGGEAIDGGIAADHWHPDVSRKKSRKLINMHKKEYGVSSIKSTGTPLFFDAVLVLADAIKRAKSTNRSRIREALAATRGFNGATGAYTFDKNGDPVKKQIVITRFENGKRVLIKEYSP